MTYGNFEDIKSTTLKKRIIHIKEWGDKDYIIQELSGKAAVILNEKLPKNGKGEPQLTAEAFPYIIAVSVVDELGNFLFDTDEKIEFLRGQSAAVLGRIANQVMFLSGINKVSKADPKNAQ